MISYDELGRFLGVSRRRAKQIASEALANAPEKLATLEAMDRLSRIAHKAGTRKAHRNVPMFDPRKDDFHAYAAKFATLPQ